MSLGIQQECKKWEHLDQDCVQMYGKREASELQRKSKTLWRWEVTDLVSKQEIELRWLNSRFRNRVFNLDVEMLGNAPKVWDVLDTQNFLLPQRRNRVWGMAFVLSGKESTRDVSTEFSDTLKGMRTNQKLPYKLIFEDLPEQTPATRHAKVIEAAHTLCPSSTSLFVDCASSVTRVAYADGVLPCLTPSHPIYSTQLKRYLTKLDYLNSQGLWKTCFSAPAYEMLLEMKSQDVAGNSFSATVCQAVVMCSLTLVPESWDTIATATTSTVAGPLVPSQPPMAPILRRLKRKQAAPEYAPCQPMEVEPPVPNKRGKARKRPGMYRRKKAGSDSRKTAPGKRSCATIWQKEQVWQPQLFELGWEVMQAYERAKKDPDIKEPGTYVKSLNLPGWFRCCMYRWKKPRTAQKWELLCKAAPRLAKVYKEPPNILRRILGKELKFKQRVGASKDTTSMLPPKFERAITECVALWLLKEKHCDMSKVKDLIQRSRGSMEALLRLTEIPDVKTSPELGAKLDALRKLPMAQEFQITWAVQKDDDESTRLPLPDWVAKPLERKIVDWASENAKWNQKIEDRASVGQSLPPTTQRRYEEFCANKSTASFLFSKKKQKMIPRLRDGADWKTMKAELVSIEIKMAEDPKELRFRVGNGEDFRMILLKGEPTSADSLPALIAEGGVSSTAFQAAFKADDPQPFKDDDNQEGEEGDQEVDPKEQQEREMEELEKNQDNEESGAEELLVQSGDEDDIQGLPVEKFVRVKNFCHRESWRHLEVQGLAQIPPGSMISYHSTTRTWQGYFDGVSTGLSCTHSGTTNRTEIESLWTVLLRLAERHCEKNPRDRLWAMQRNKLHSVGLTVAKL
eukprot:Skav216151  [mRNA]  locus=scaffold3056:86003:94647:- [translate_table: standard]